jgi:hypothetical protein
MGCGKYLVSFSVTELINASRFFDCRLIGQNHTFSLGYTVGGHAWHFWHNNQETRKGLKHKNQIYLVFQNFEQPQDAARLGKARLVINRQDARTSLLICILTTGCLGNKSVQIYTTSFW